MAPSTNTISTQRFEIVTTNDGEYITTVIKDLSTGERLITTQHGPTGATTSQELEAPVTLNCGHEKVLQPGQSRTPGAHYLCLECKPKRIGHPRIRTIV